MSGWIRLFLQAEEGASLEMDVYPCHRAGEGSEMSSFGQFEIPA